jgi:hypothetical protein
MAGVARSVATLERGDEFRECIPAARQRAQKQIAAARPSSAGLRPEHPETARLKDLAIEGAVC